LNTPGVLNRSDEKDRKVHRLDRAQWVLAVTRMMCRDWCIDTADAGLSDDDLTRHWLDGADPGEFVLWFSEKYDLIRFDQGESNVRRHA
jgi:hypothetical protein